MVLVEVCSKNMSYTKQQLIGAFKKLPEVERDLFMASETSEAVWSVAKKYNISGTQKNDFVDIVSFVLLNLESPENLIERLNKTIGVDINLAIAIKDDLVRLVFNKFESFYKQGHQFSIPKNTAVTSSKDTSIGELVSPEVIRTNVDAICQRQNLSQNQKTVLVELIGKILGGSSALSKFRTNLVDELNVSYDQALKISFDVNMAIFNPVMETLKEMESNMGTDEGYRKNNQVDSEAKNSSNPKDESTLSSLKRRFANTTRPDLNPEHLIPDHDEMEREDGTPHLHSQSVMPRNQSEISSGNFMPMPKKAGVQSFSSAIDQKLSQVSKPSQSSAAPATDPYREPIN